MASEQPETLTPGPAGLIQGHCQGRQSRLGHHTCKQRTEWGPRRARQWTNKAIRLEKGCSTQAGMLLVHPQYTHLMDSPSCARRFSLILLSSQQAPENNSGRI